MNPRRMRCFRVQFVNANNVDVNDELFVFESKAIHVRKQTYKSLAGCGDDSGKDALREANHSKRPEAAFLRTCAKKRQR